MRILYLTANAQLVIEPKDASGKGGTRRDYPPLDLWPELEQVTMALFDARSEGRVQLEVVPEVKPADIRRYLSERPVDVVHFSGHGDKIEDPEAGPDADSGKEPEHHLILMHEEHEGLFGAPVSNQWLADQLRGYDIKLLVLNCCWSEGVAQALKGTADCVIGTKTSLRNDLAAKFSGTLYEGLEKGLTLRELNTYFQDNDAFKEQYVPVPADDAVLDTAIQPIPLDERDMSPARRVLQKQHELITLQKQIGGRFRIEGIKIALAALVAGIGWVLIRFLLPMVVPDHFQYLTAMLQWEPVVVMAAIAGNPLGRLASAGLIRLGSTQTIRMLRALSLKAPAEIERELETGRIAAMFEWLESWKSSKGIATAAPEPSS